MSAPTDDQAAALEFAAALGIPAERMTRGNPHPNAWVQIAGIRALGRDCETCKHADRGVPLINSCITTCHRTADGRGSAYMQRGAL